MLSEGELTMVRYWARKKAAGEEMLPVYGVMHLHGSNLAFGTIQAQDINLNRAKHKQLEILKATVKPGEPRPRVMIRLYKPESYTQHIAEAAR